MKRTYKVSQTWFAYTALLLRYLCVIMRHSAISNDRHWPMIGEMQSECPIRANTVKSNSKKSYARCVRSSVVSRNTLLLLNTEHSLYPTQPVLSTYLPGLYSVGPTLTFTTASTFLRHILGVRGPLNLLGKLNLKDVVSPKFAFRLIFDAGSLNSPLD